MIRMTLNHDTATPPRTGSLNRIARAVLLTVSMLGLCLLGTGQVWAQGKSDKPTEATRLRGLVALEIDLPQGYTVKSIEGLNFFVHYIAQAEPRKDGKFNALGVYVGFDPRRFCEEGHQDTKTRPAKFGRWESEWRDCPSPKTPGAFHREVWLESGYENVTLHLFVSGNEKEEMDFLEAVARSLRIADIKK